MKKIYIIFFLLLIIPLLLSSQTRTYPDFEYIIQSTNEAFRQQAAEYETLIDIMRSTKNMDNYDVSYYKIDIAIDFDTEFIDASITIKAEIVEDAVSEIEMNLTNNLDVTEIIQNNVSLLYNHADDIITITLDGSYSAGDSIELAISYEGNPQNRLNDGMLFNSHNGVPNVFTMVSPMGARKWWPCKDTPADKPDSLDIWITYPEQYVSASNGLLAEQINNGNGTVTDKWHESYPVATYLTSLAITNYDMYSQTYESNGTIMSIDHYVFPELYDACVNLFSITPDMIEFFESIYGEYPFLNEKYGHAVCAGLSALAMEHQTCTSFRSGYIADPGAESTVAHELSHQWAGDCLSITNWAHVWLKEGFARYSEALWAEHLYGSTGLHDYMNALDTGSDMDPCLYRDPNGTGSHIFNIVIYSKGAWTMHMLRGVIGEDNYFDLIGQLFLDPAFRYGNFDTFEFRDKAEEVSGMDLDWFFQEWFYNEGRPYYNYTTYTSDLEDSLVIVTQSIGSHGANFAMMLPVIVNDNEYQIFADSGYAYNPLPLAGSLDSLIFDLDNWVLDDGYYEKIPELEEINTTRGAILLVWNDFFDPAIEGYNIYRKEAGGSYMKINDNPIDALFYFDEDVVAGTEYFYKIAAVLNDNRGFVSPFSNEVSGSSIDFSLDQGILLVDETAQGSSTFPSNAEIDSFYHYLLDGYDYTDWDVDETGLPPLSELAKYSSIVWHSDEVFSTQFTVNEYSLKSYLLAGGNMFISGWKHLPNPSPLYETYLHVAEPIYNSTPDFAGTFGETGLSDLDVVEDKVPLAPWEDNLGYIYKLTPINEAESIYKYNSSLDDPDWEGMPCALRYGGDYNLYLLGFPLYYMNESGARELMQQAMQDFGEIYAVDPQAHESIALSIYPQPTEDECLISYSIEKPSKVKIDVYNIKGQLIEILQNREQSAGEYNLAWNIEMLSSGMYFMRFDIGNSPTVHKILIID
ncbi:MAG TPA: T9SS type A sorting domain-containing protein [Candidatus Cloacimonetes bacterium]|nr:T9SS type A sorting domain-containing protein [Candidatus Cloacimonadota bacterium]HEX37723.1 T9SS type A sorting domain-containing protein [Candidatus Cloacimonadota bacterium]